MASVLIVEDDRINAEEMAETMRAAGHTVVGVTISGDQALSLAEQVEPDLALVDVKLRGDTDGITVADTLQDRLDVAVVYVTGYADQEVLQRATRTAAYGYVLKPIDPRNLQAACSMALALHERDRAKRERRRAERLDSLATLAAGIAHDFNNMLAIMQSSAALAKQAAAGNEKVHELLVDIEHAAERASALTAQLVSFAKGGAPVRRPRDLARLVGKVSELALRGSATKLEWDVPVDLWPVLVDETQVTQVFANLVINARHAMNEAGQLDIAARNRTLGEDDPMLPAGRYVEVTVADRGAGIPQSDLDRIFDPFFTTKQNGSGLGLASAYSIVKRHGGALRAVSTLGHGTTFHVFLPAAPNGDHSEEDAVEPVKDQGRVLVMDDEPDLRRVLALCLEELGYDVEQAAHAEEALARYEHAFRNGSRFDLVILDLTVREGEGGVVALERLRAIDPGVVAVATSGYSDSPVLADHERHGFAGALPKPYRFAMLSQVLRKLSRRLQKHGARP